MKFFVLKPFIVFILALLSGPYSYATPACNAVLLKKITPGHTCITTQGVVFKLVSRDSSGSAEWQDLSSGLIWMDILPGFQNQREAEASCRALADGVRVPTDLQWLDGERHGIREVLPHMRGYEYRYWSSYYPNSYSYVFKSKNGGLYFYNYFEKFNSRCVR